MSNIQVWCLGDVVVDLLPDGPQRYRQCPGGAPANVAVALSRLNIATGFIGCRGGDPFGQFMNDTLVQEGINTEHLVVDEAHLTSTVLVSLDAHGERQFTFLVNPSADQFLQSAYLPQFQAGQWLQLSSIALAGEVSRTSTKYAMAKAKQCDAKIFFDVNIRPSLWTDEACMITTIQSVLPFCDVVKVSEEEAFLLTGEAGLTQALTSLASMTPALLVVTMGALGAKVLDTTKWLDIPACDGVQVVDSTGAGDGFVGGMLSVLAKTSVWRQSDVIERAVRLGNRVGAFVVTQKGAMSALPTEQQLECCC
ncbi:aminoimidazole riboside kinase [Celerinatantimonas yamalensis]|uniref:Aminoimidazole riboside kinase n=1 Tax=Celerinatantimonas yamalensis TaxID=559956 RepID=A0ABW9GB64_9GAMM